MKSDDWAKIQQRLIANRQVQQEPVTAPNIIASTFTPVFSVEDGNTHKQHEKRKFGTLNNAETTPLPIKRFKI